jgi:tetratricopeptide (TPR) repeat protein
LTRDEEGAVKTYQKLLALEPSHKNALYNLANLKKQQGRIAEAQSLYRRLIEAHRYFVAGYVNLAKSHSDCGDYDEAEKLLRQALALEPQHAFARWNLSHLLLRSQRWTEGWRDYEARLQLPNWLAPPVVAPAWQGDAKARRILLWNDQGIGDAIQFLRYPRLLAERGHEVWILVQDNLKKIAATASGVTGAVGPSDRMPEVDAQAPLLSMPHRLAVPDPQASWNSAYLKAPNIMNLPQKAGHRAIGLVWAGNQRHVNNVNRSAALADLMPLFALPGIDWFSLQFGEAARQIDESNLAETICDLSPRLHDFADTAAAISALDLVISIDTSVAHLAGALGVECWLMLPTKPDWRWAGQGAETPWYPDMRIFRQKNPGDWKSLAAIIADALRED